MLECLIIIGVLVYFVLEWRRRKPMLTDVTKRPVFVTGCDSGFGRAVALRLDAQGTPVFAGCYTKEGAQSLAQESSDRLTTVPLDVSSTESIKKARDVVQANLPSGTELWGIINNAGIAGQGGPLEWQCRQNFIDVYQVNLVGMAEMCRVFLPLLKKSKGRIVNVTSSIAFNPFPGTFSYCTSKCAAEGLGDLLRRELWQWGVTVHLIEPGLFKTAIVSAKDFVAKSQAQWDNLPQDVKDEYGEDFHKEITQGIKKGIEAAAPVDLSPVVNSMVHALFAVNPKIRYLPGHDAKISLICSYLPSSVSDWLMKRMLKNSPKPRSLQNL